jgi:hypothetical protein
LAKKATPGRRSAGWLNVNPVDYTACIGEFRNKFVKDINLIRGASVRERLLKPSQIY